MYIYDIYNIYILLILNKTSLATEKWVQSTV